MTGDAAEPLPGPTWHHGVVARWWAHFGETRAEEFECYAEAIRRFGEPALDLGCGTGRLLRPLLDAGFDVDGIDVSDDMLAWCPPARVRRQAMHELEVTRPYRTIVACDSFGIGGSRRADLETLQRVAAALEPGGAFVFSVELLGGRDATPTDWTAGRRRRAADGSEYQLTTRVRAVDPVEQRRVLEVRARQWTGGVLVADETRELAESLYLAPEIALMLHVTGFQRVAAQGAYTRAPVTADDAAAVFVAEV